MTEITVRFNLSFSRRFLSAAGALAIMLCAVPELDSESVTLSTYYPAPSGVYTNMITTGNTFLARDGGAATRVGIGTVAPAYKLDVNGTMRATGNMLTDSTFTSGGTITAGGRITGAGVTSNGSIAGSFGIVPNYVGWSTYGTGAGGAAIYNDNGTYQGLMVVGNNSGGGGVRRVKVWDELTVNGAANVTGAVISRQICTDTWYGLGVKSCPAGRYATYTSGILVQKMTTVGTTDPSGTMLCCPCPTGGCPSL